MIQKNILSFPIIIIISLVILSSCSELIQKPENNRDRSSFRKDEFSGSLNGTGARIYSYSGLIQERKEKFPVFSHTGKKIPSPEKNPVPEKISPENISAPKTLSKTLSYNAPEDEIVTLTFTLQMAADGLISGVSANMISGNHESSSYINRFNRSINAQVIGKKISELSLDAVGGASLTTNAFNSIITSL